MKTDDKYGGGLLSGWRKHESQGGKTRFVSRSYVRMTRDTFSSNAATTHMHQPGDFLSNRLGRRIRSFHLKFYNLIMSTYTLLLLASPNSSICIVVKEGNSDGNWLVF